MPAYNLARFLGRAIDSALAQDWPAEALEVIVVDDGSTDETPQVLAAYGDRIRAVRQPNGGLVRAVDRGLAEVTGDYVALLDADDEWPTDRLTPPRRLPRGPPRGRPRPRRHDDRRRRRRGHRRPPSSRPTARSSRAGASSGACWPATSSPAARRPSAPRCCRPIHPIPDDAAYPDWWIAATIAAVAEIDHVPGCANLYRYHGANMGLGSGAEDMHRILGKEIPWRRWMLRHLVHDPTVSAADLRAAYSSWEYGLVTAALGAGLAPSDVVTATAPERERSVAGRRRRRRRPARRRPRPRRPPAAERHRRGPVERRRAPGPRDRPAAGREPARAGRRARPRHRRARDARGRRRPPAPRPTCWRPTPARPRPGDDATLVVVYDSADELQGLAALVEQLGLDGDDSPDIAAEPAPATQPAQRLLAARATATLGAPRLAAAA